MKNKGMLLEKLINKTILFYKNNNLALFHKKELDIKFHKVNNNFELVGAKIKSQSTIDYYGIHDGMFVAFEAKSTDQDTFAFRNLKSHQLKYLNKIVDLGGVAFIILGFNSYSRYFILPINFICEYYKKSLNIKEIPNSVYELELTFPGILDFIPVIKKCG